MMKNTTITKCNFIDLKDLFDEYLDTLTGVGDDFWESHILRGVGYLIKAAETKIGFFHLCQEPDYLFLSSFYVKPEYTFMGTDLMKHIIEEYHVEKAFVLTCDEHFLTLCMENQKSVALQACLFDGTIKYPCKEPEYDASYITRVTMEELPSIRKATGDFYNDFSDEDIASGKYELYQVKEKGILLGVGVYVPNQLKTGYVPCGEIVLEEHRKKGVARSLQLYMADLCRERGLIPIGGCWYKNTASRKTFESVGRYTKTRILNVTF
ncbi:GNAT family N-acetyltransferase [Anaerosporobacter faecicola]|uniref:GNAT family N-acetyltransferase n=1 Tax=Anaerosporobacter faecicola TaxID=2718714 RepID=UPI001439A076|nr:GNAT family N-acetyltransferase [Anaerosporobacter faecicola]